MSKQGKLIFVLAFVLMYSCKPENGQKTPLIEKQVVFLYYSDMTKAVNFYENSLGFKKSYDNDWVKIYKTNSGSSIGVVDILKAGYSESAEKQVMVSFQVSNIKGWYAYIKTTDVKILKPLDDASDVPIKAFLIEDPEGYKIEFFKWN